MKKLIPFAILLFAVLFNACQKFETTADDSFTNSDIEQIAITNLSELNISDNFDWRTTKTLEVTIKLPVLSNFKSLKIQSLDGTRTYFNGYPEDNSNVIRTKVTVPTYVEAVKIKYGNGIDIPAIEIPVDANTLSFDFPSLLKTGGGGSDCECDGGITALTLKFLDNVTNATIKVYKSNHFGGADLWYTFNNMSQNDIFSFIGKKADDKMGAKIFLVVNDDENHATEIHTSCSQEIYVGQTWGSTHAFKIEAGTSFNNGDLCSTNGDDDDNDNFFGTLAFEDLWPGEGDYDINDLVVEYDFDITKDLNDNVESITAEFTIRAFGASFRNGFGFTFPNVSPNDIANVSGYSIQSGSIYNISSNGVESGHSAATFIAFDNTYNIMTHPGSGIGVNTHHPAAYVTPVTITLEITFVNNAVTYSQLDIGNFNPFIVVNQDRGVEVHLPDYPPTILHTASFGTFEDDSNPGIGRYYKTEANLFWAINIPETFDYPNEKQIITGAYNYFAAWATSGGTSYPDWYKDLPGYRNNSAIY